MDKILLKKLHFNAKAVKEKYVIKQIANSDQFFKKYKELTLFLGLSLKCQLMETPQGFVEGPFIQATERLEFEDEQRIWNQSEVGNSFHRVITMYT